MGIFFSSFNGLEVYPKLRFKNASGQAYTEWKKNKLVNFLSPRVEKQTPTKDAPLMAFTAENGVTDKGERYDRSFLVKSDDKLYKRTEFNDFIYSSNNLDVGSIGLNKFGTAVISDVYEIFKVNDKAMPDFVSELIQRPYTLSRILRYRQGCLYGQYKIYADDFLSVDVFAPSLDEQRKINNFLTAIDARIEKQRQLVEALKKYKRGLLSAIFERKLEFSSSTWHSVALSECCNGFDNLRKPISSELREKGTIPYYGANGIQDYVKNYIFDGEYILLAEDGGHFDDFTNSSIAQYITGKSWVNNHAHILQAKPGYNNKYIYYTLVHKDIRKYINGTSRAKLNQEDMWQIKIITPDISTQNKIARFMTAIDEKISQEEYNLFQFYKIKRGLLQQMFI